MGSHNASTKADDTSASTRLARAAAIFESLEPRLLLAGSIEGTIWHDLNADGVRDAGEPGLNGRTIEVVNLATGAVVVTQATSSVDVNGDGAIDPETESGLYSFAGLGDGEYEVRQVPQPGWILSTPLATGELTVVQTLLDGQDGVDGLDGPNNVAISADGKYVYVAGYHEDALAVFSRDAVTGQLTFVGAWRNGIEGVDGLEGPSGVTVTPDGRHVYVAGLSSNSLVVFAQDSQTGALSFVQPVKDDVGGVEGLSGANSVTVSPDGAYVYAAGRNDAAIAVFSRNVATGELNFVEAVTNGWAGISGLDSVRSIAVSPDGRNLYAAGSGDDAVVMFARDNVTGMLSILGVLTDGVGGIEGLVDPWDVSVSPDGRHVYVASFDYAVSVFSRDAATGELAFVDVLSNRDPDVAGLNRPVALTISPEGGHVYVAALGGACTTAVFARNIATGELTFVQEAPESGSRSSSVAISLDGQHVYTTSSSYDRLTAFSRRDQNVHYVTVVGGQAVASRDFGSYQLGAVAGQVYEDVNGNFLRDAGEPGLDGRTVELVDPAGGVVQATLQTASVDLNGDGTIDPATEAGLYVFTDLSPADYDVRLGLAAGWLLPPSGPAVYSLTLSSGEQAGVADFASVRASSISGVAFQDLDGNGARSPGEPGLNGVTIELIDPADGQVLQSLQTVDDGGYAFEDLLPGTYAVREAAYAGWMVTGPATGTYTQALIPGTLMMDQDFGNQALPGQIRGQKYNDIDANGIHDAGEAGLDGWTIELVDSASGIVVDTQVTASIDLNGDGVIDPEIEAGLYAFGGMTEGEYDIRETPQVGWVSTSGGLALVQTLVDGADGVDGLDHPFGVTVSPDGTCVYATGWNDNALVVFTRDVVTGQLTFVGVWCDGEAGGDGLEGAFDVAVTRDRRHVYVSSYTDDAITVFAQDPDTHALSVVQIVRNGSEGARLNSVRGLTLSDGDATLYAAARSDSALNVFSRNDATGELSLVQTLRYGADGGAEFSGAYCTAISPDGANLYLASTVGDAIVWFTRDPASGMLSEPGFFRHTDTGVAALDGAQSLAISPDGRHVYVGGHGGGGEVVGGVAAYSRDLATGELSLVQSLIDSPGASDGLSQVTAIVISPDGRDVYVMSKGDNAVTTFLRDSVTGLLFLVGVSVDAATLPWAGAMSPDGGHVYVTDLNDALRVYSRGQLDRHHVTVSAAMPAIDLYLGAHQLTSASPSVLDLQPISDTGYRSYDDMTTHDNSTPARALEIAVHGTVAGAAVTLYADGMAIGLALATEAMTLVTTDGETVLADGVWSFTARQVQPGMLASPESQSRLVLIDTVAPTASVPDLAAGSDTGVSNSDNITRGEAPVFEGTADDGGSGVWKVDVMSDDGKSGADGVGPFYSVMLATLDEGSRSVTATVYDRAGNTFTTGVLALTVTRPLTNLRIAVGESVDTVVTAEAAMLGGDDSLEIVVSGGGNAFKAGTYTMLQAGGGLSGTFANVTVPAGYVSVNGNGLTYDYEAGTVTLTLDMDLNPGDGNLDGATDVADRIIWNNHNFTEGTTWATGDYNNDGATDVADRIIWNNHNFTEATAALTPQALDVPMAAALPAAQASVTVPGPQPEQSRLAEQAVQSVLAQVPSTGPTGIHVFLEASSLPADSIDRTPTIATDVSALQTASQLDMDLEIELMNVLGELLTSEEAQD